MIVQDRSWPGRALLPAALALFVTLGLIGILHHEMWRDELEIWLIARDSHSLRHLFHNMRTEGHPALWYLLVYAVSRLWSDPLSMQLLHLAIASGSVALILRYAPFSIWTRLLLCFSYYLFYEYTIISRSYGLEFLLAFAFCALYPRRETRLPWMALLLAGMANTTLYGAILAANLALLMILEAWFAAGRVYYPKSARVVPSLLLVVAGVALGVGQVVAQSLRIGPAHYGYHPPHDLEWLILSLATLQVGYLPLPDFRTITSWNSSILDALPSGLAVGIGASTAALLFASSAWLLAARRSVLAFFSLASVAMLCVTLFVWFGQVRHHGHLFLLFVICCWLQHSVRDGGEDRRPVLRERFLTALLAVQFVAGVYAFVADLRYPFSNAKAVAGFLEQGPYADRVLVGSHDFAAQSVAAYVTRPFFHPENQKFGTFVDWGANRRNTLPIDALHAAMALATRQGEPVLLILNVGSRDFEKMWPALQVASGAYTRLAAGFDGAIVGDENFVVVWVHPKSAGQ